MTQEIGTIGPRRHYKLFNRSASCCTVLGVDGCIDISPLGRVRNTADYLNSVGDTHVEATAFVLNIAQNHLGIRIEYDFINV